MDNCTAVGAANYPGRMFEWSQLAQRVASGGASPLDGLPALATLSDEALLALDQDEALAVIEISQAALASLAAVQALSIEAFARREQDDIELMRAEAAALGLSTQGFKDAHDVVPAMLAPVLHVAPRTMANVLGETRLLVNDLPTTLALARAGRLEVSRARAVASEACLVDRARRACFERELYGSGDVTRLDHVTRLTHGSLTRKASIAAVRVDPGAATSRAAFGLRDRDVQIRPAAEPGMTAWWSAQPADVSLKAWTAIDALAAEYVAGQPTLTIAQARADAMMSLILGQSTITTVVDLVVPAPSADESAAKPTPEHPCYDTEGATDQATDASTPAGTPAGTRSQGTTSGSPAPTESQRHEPRDDARAAVIRVAFGDLGNAFGGLQCVVGVHHRRVGILLNEQVMALLADPDVQIRLHSADTDSGVLTRHDPKVYRPGAALSRAVRARDGTCRMPGCTTPAVRCQLDHVTPFPNGPTEIENLACLCTSHHGFKHHAGWTLTMAPTGTCTWTSPLKRTYVTHPQDYRDLAA